MTEVDKHRILRGRRVHAGTEWVEQQQAERVDLRKIARRPATVHIGPSNLGEPSP